MRRSQTAQMPAKHANPENNKIQFERKQDIKPRIFPSENNGGKCYNICNSPFHLQAKCNRRLLQRVVNSCVAVQSGATSSHRPRPAPAPAPAPTGLAPADPAAQASPGAGTVGSPAHAQVDVNKVVVEVFVNLMEINLRD